MFETPLTELELALNYHLVLLYFSKIQVLTTDDITTIITEILKREGLLKKYEPLLEELKINFTLPLDLLFNDFQQIKYEIYLKDKSIAKNLILDFRVIY